MPKLISSDTEEKIYTKSFSDASNSSDIKEKVVKQINILKLFDMEPYKAISKKHFVSEEENNCKEGTNLTPQDRIGNIDWCKCGCKFKPMTRLAESFCLLLRLKSWSMRGSSSHSAFLGNCLTISRAC